MIPRRVVHRSPRTRAIVGALVVMIGGAFAYVAVRPRWVSAPGGTQDAKDVSAVPPTPRWLDGAPLPISATQPAAVAVVIDNAPEARPPAGLGHAPLVFEVPVEGRRTRFVAVYPLPVQSSDTPSGDSAERAPTGYTGAIGPVRSARPYLVGLAEAIGAPLVHVGGSTAALALLKTRRHVNQYFDPPFTRDRSRSAPFNVFTTIGALADFVAARGWVDDLQERKTVLHPRLWPFTSAVDKELVVGDGHTVHFAFSDGERAFVVGWTYDEGAGVYIRTEGGVALRDRDGTPVTATNVVVLTVRSRVLDDIGRLRIAAFEPPIASSFEGLIHAEDAAVLRGGQRINGRWSWEDAPSDAGLFGLRQMRDTESGEPELLPIPLAPGTTWVEVIDWKDE